MVITRQTVEVQIKPWCTFCRSLTKLVLCIKTKSLFCACIDQHYIILFDRCFWGDAIGHCGRCKVWSNFFEQYNDNRNTHCNISWIETSIPNIQNMTYVLQRLFMNGILQYDNNNSISRICQKERFIDTIMANILYWFWVICAMLSIKPARDIKMKRGKVFFFNFFIHPSKNAAIACSFKRLCIRYLL